MARKKKPLPLLERVTITDYAAEGKALARLDDGMVVFVPWTAPGDVCDLQVRRKKHSFAEAEAVKYYERSEQRAQPFCAHYGVCGGCKWQHITYEAQLRMKQQQVSDQLTRIGHLQLPEIQPVLGSEKTREYRNKLDFGCADKRYLTREQIESGEQGMKSQPAIGFHITGAFDKILPIDTCHLMAPLHNEIRNSIRDYAVEHGLTFFDLRRQVGLLRDVIIRCSNTGEWMVILQVHIDHQPSEAEVNGQRSTVNGQWSMVNALLQHLVDHFPQITSLMYVDNQKCNDTIGDQEIRLFHGKDHITEAMEDLRFKVGPKSFYQTNTRQAYRLYSVVRNLAGLTGSELVYDLYTGTGTIACFVARQARQVVGIEYVEEAISDAKTNARLNGIDNTLFYAGDMKDILTDDFVDRHGRPDVVITDPPRAGMHPDVVRTLLRTAPQRIVYVSCNPATQARDLQAMADDYLIEKIQPVDMFPHTPHVENVVLLIRR